MRNISKKPSTSKFKLLLFALITLVTLTAVVAWHYNKQPMAANKSTINKPVAVCGIKS
jgi:cell division protein FtsL